MSDKPTPCIHGRNFCLECHCVKHDKANCQTCTEWHAEEPKPRCPVFGCTIPRGIPHEHPAGVSVVMRDPAGPLDAFERAELDQFRRDARQRQHTEQQRRLFLHAQAHQNAWASFGLGQQHDPDTATSQAHAMDQLMRHHRDEALLHVAAMTPPPPFIIEGQLADAITHGTGFALDGKHIPVGDVYVVPAYAKIHGGRKLTQALLEAGRIRRETADLGVVFNEAPAPRRSFVSTTARVAFWIVLAVTVCIWIFAGVKS